MKVGAAWQHSHTDEPKSLRFPDARLHRFAAIEESHVAPLTGFVRKLRLRMGSEYGIPYFDPFDGGIRADCLFLLEAPGPQAVTSEFISRNNDDETARNLFLLTKEAGIHRRRSVVWNIVPWYIGSGKKIRSASKTDLGLAAPALIELTELLPALRSVVLLGKNAASARNAISKLTPNAQIHCAPHPSPLFVNRRPENRGILLLRLKEIASALPEWAGEPL